MVFRVLLPFYTLEVCVKNSTQEILTESGINKMVECEKCFKYYNPVIPEECSLCRDYPFPGNILCDLTQSAQDTSNNFECYSFKPNLSVVDKNKEVFESLQIDDKKVQLSERQKWLKAYAIQQWKYDSDKIFSSLNYHVCLITDKREKTFATIKDQLPEFTSIFDISGDHFNGKLSALCVGPDHLHLHVESPPEYSADEVVNKIILSLESAFKNEFPYLFDKGNEIFAKSYFIETMG